MTTIERLGRFASEMRNCNEQDLEYCLSLLAVAVQEGRVNEMATAMRVESLRPTAEKQPIDLAGQVNPLVVICQYDEDKGVEPFRVLRMPPGVDQIEAYDRLAESAGAAWLAAYDDGDGDPAWARIHPGDDWEEQLFMFLIIRRDGEVYAPCQ